MNQQLINDQYLRLIYSIRKSIDNFYHSLPEEDEVDSIIRKVITDSALYNNWFVADHMIHALALLADDLETIVSMDTSIALSNKKVAVLHRTDAPLEGIAEILLMAKAGFQILVKPTEELFHLDNDLYSLICLLTGLSGQISITEGNLRGVDAVVSFTELGDTLKNYLEKYPVLQLHQKGTGIVIDGNESSNQLIKIAEMSCMYFGRGQQNIRVLYVPDDYNLNLLATSLEQYADLLHNNRYFNNYEYRKSAMIINNIKYIESGPLLLTEQQSQAGFISVVCFQRYKSKEVIFCNKLLDTYPLFEEESVGDNLYDDLRLTSFKRNKGRLIEFVEMISKTVIK